MDDRADDASDSAWPLILCPRQSLERNYSNDLRSRDPLVYYLIQASDRHRIPILYVTFGAALAVLATPLERLFLHTDLGRRLVPAVDEHAFGKKS